MISFFQTIKNKQMKKITVLLLFISSVIYSQTTEVEYNYLTKGYRGQMQKGLDLKLGYQLVDVFQKDVGIYHFDYKVFLTDEKLSAIYVSVSSERSFSVNVYDLCIPFGNNDLLQEYYNSLSMWDSSILRAYSVATSELLSNTLYNTLIKELSYKD